MNIVSRKFDKNDFKKSQRIIFDAKQKYIGGSGGSSNLIHIGDKFVYKIIPYFFKHKFEKIRRNNDQMEILVYDLLERDFLSKNITQHIVGYYDNYKTNLKRIVNIRCQTEEESYSTKTKPDNLMLCELKDGIKRGKIKEISDVVVIEKCDWTIEKWIYNILESKSILKYIRLKEELIRIIFQVIFTLAVIQHKFPSFVHNDLFLRNILGKVISNHNDHNDHSDDEYDEYIFGDKKFYLKTNGFCVKINDFGYALERNKFLSTNIFVADEFKNSMPTIDCKKCDLFNFLHDLYDGQNLGGKSVMQIIKKKSQEKKTFVRNIFKKFLDVKLIDKINKHGNKSALDRTWSIKNNKYLNDVVSEPKDYLLSNVFDKLKLPKGGKIINVWCSMK